MLLWFIAMGIIAFCIAAFLIRIGRSPAYALFCFIPLGYVGLIWWLSKANWPNEIKEISGSLGGHK